MHVCFDFRVQNFKDQITYSNAAMKIINKCIEWAQSQGQRHQNANWRFYVLFVSFEHILWFFLKSSQFIMDLTRVCQGILNSSIHLRVIFCIYTPRKHQKIPVLIFFGGCRKGSLAADDLTCQTQPYFAAMKDDCSKPIAY